MLLTILQAQTIINRFNHLNINQPVPMENVNDVISSFEGNINIEDPAGLKLYLQAHKDIYIETEKLDISVSG